MAGRMGGVRTTAPRLTLHGVDTDRGLLLIKGAVPGPSGGLVLVRSAVKSPLLPRRDPELKGDGEMSAVKVVSAVRQGRGADVDLPAEIFDAKVNVPLIHQVVVAQEAAARQGTHAVKTRGEVRGGGTQAVPAEGHRAGQAGLDPRAAVRRRRRGARPGAPLLRAADAEEDEGRRAARRAVRPGRHGRVHVVSGFIDGDVPRTKDAAALLATVIGGSAAARTCWWWPTAPTRSPGRACATRRACT